MASLIVGCIYFSFDTCGTIHQVFEMSPSINTVCPSSNEIEVDIYHSMTKFSKKRYTDKNVLMLLRNRNWFSEEIPYDTTV